MDGNSKFLLLILALALVVAISVGTSYYIYQLEQDNLNTQNKLLAPAKDPQTGKDIYITETVPSVIKRNSEDFRQLYEDFFPDEKEGLVRLSFYILATGQVAMVKVQKSDFTSENFHKELESIFANIRFPMFPPSEKKSIDYTMSFPLKEK